MEVANGPRTVSEITDEEDRLRAQRLLAHVFHEVLAETNTSSLLELIADSLAELVPHDSLSVYRADERRRELIPVLARDKWAEEILNDRTFFGEGITGWAVENREAVRTNAAHLDPRRMTVAGTPEGEPEALVSVPLIVRGLIKGALNIYRFEESGCFSDEEFELAKMFGDAAALGLDNAEVHAALEHQANTDSLTGLFNHRYFHDRVHSELLRSVRVGDSVAVVMLDIDDFKRINDVYGHDLGDDILVMLGQQLEACKRASDVVCRIGGEEFGVVMPSSTAEDAQAFAERFKGRSSTLDEVGEVTVSVGISEGPVQATHAKTLTAYAENAMMTAKTQGRDRVLIYDPGAVERPGELSIQRGARSLAHLKMLQGLARKLNRLGSVKELGSTITQQLRTFIGCSYCWVYAREGDGLTLISCEGDAGGLREGNSESWRHGVAEEIAGKAAQGQTPLLISNSLTSAYEAGPPGAFPTEESLMAVPLTYGRRCVGVVVTTKAGSDQFDSDEVRLLEVLAGHAAVALEYARLFEAQKREAEHARALLEFGRTLASAEGQDEIASFAAQLATELLDVPMTSVWLQRARSDDLHAVALCGYSDDERSRLSVIRFDAEFIQRYGHRSEPFVIDGDAIPWAHGLREKAHERSWAVAPFALNGDRVGIIVCGAPVLGRHRFSQGDIELLTGIANQTKLAMGKAGMFDDLEDTFLSTIESLASALEAKDEGTSSHARSIRDKASALGERIGVMGQELKRLEIAALFHDIGKIGIPTDVLLKPGRLTKDERMVIETHPEVGERILRPIERLQDVAWIVRNCHEEYDGSGYPDGRKGEDIPLEARIILVCDAFDAMISDRPYRKRLSVAEACRRLTEASGSQLDPRLVPVFLDLVKTTPAAADSRRDGQTQGRQKVTAEHG
ncbi:MAG: diguanylate cyclase [Actinomycetota bacterium]|nr:diguanylate cyclase [Actinomycetota bacterium]